MIIESSRVSMQSSRSYRHFESQEKASIEVKGNRDAVSVFISDESKSKLSQLKEKQQQLKEDEREAEKQRKEDEARTAAEMLKLSKQQNNNARYIPPEEDAMITMLKRVLAILNGKSAPKDINYFSLDEIKLTCGQPSSFTLFSGSGEPTVAPSSVISADVNTLKGLQSSGNMWTKMTVSSSFVSEAETTQFSSVGLARTADGREINFNIDVEMSRSFEKAVETVDYVSVFKDPLVINVDSSVAEVSDMKFRFDLDADGQEDEVSMATGGSRFLAYDKNGDGKINDGSELFGARTGDGFGELAQYDTDHNGWIDEADEIYNKLILWTKDKHGNDVKMSLRDADVGAIYLGRESTQFSLKDDNNKTNAAIRATGIYLKESGGVGTIQHVDLAI